MPAEATLLSAFIVGLLGGVHCAGMCGGIVGALTLGLPGAVRTRPRRLLPYVLAYNGGRIASYALAGAAMGALGALITDLTALHQARLVLQVVAGAFLVALGLYLGGWWFGLQRIERAGTLLWRYIEPLGRRLLPVRSPAQALVVGALWGWLPCGLVYSVLIWSISAGSALQGGLLMLSFGLGTLPLLAGLGMSAGGASRVLRRRWVRGLAGLAVAGYGVWLAGVALVAM